MKPINMSVDDTYNGDCGALVCPNCGSLYLYHTKVEIFSRVEDAQEGHHVIHTVHAQKTTVAGKANLLGNPSPRRSGLIISFECENCDETSSLEILQHKGSTYVGWGE